MHETGDPIADDQLEFIRLVVAMLESHRRAGDFDGLVVFAERDIIGQLRQMTPQLLRDRVVREVAKNYLHLPAGVLSEVIARELTEGPGPT